MVDLLRLAAERARRRPFFLASALLPYAEAEGLDDAALAAQVGCSLADLPALLLCRRPSDDPRRFRKDVERMAAHCRADPTRLASLLRLALATERLRAPTVGRSQLVAARDRVDEEGAPG